MEPATTIFFASIIGFISALIQSLTGFGFAIISIPLFLMIYDPKQIVLIQQLIGIFLNVYLIYLVRKDIDFHFLGILCLGSILGQPLGLLIYTFGSSTVLKIMVSCKMNLNS